MNIILFDSDSESQALPKSDLRAQHILKVLKCNLGDTFHAGVINGSFGQGTLTAINDKELVLHFTWTKEQQTVEDIQFIIGLPRPQTARKILNTLSTLGASAIHFVQTDKSDKNYTSSKLWSTDEWSRHLIDGAQQAFTTTIPKVHWDQSLYKTVKALPTDTTKIALDNYEGSSTLGHTEIKLPLIVAIGPEQGWSDKDRDILRRHGFHLAHLGTRVLRVETACVSTLSIIKSKLGLM
ncbi:MAG: 16S rRNA (uracil(1498)-N(3))-methyltransferase [Candidatus Latescibacteria bacterium]|nr:16S rRNA (uracil(1498)-N(3))-methyltransferase [Candidatus Latescibacterota bacterium]